jgi:hypothetical protein
VGEEDPIARRIGRSLIVSILLLTLAACGGDEATPVTTSAAGVVQSTVAPLSATGTECRNALTAVDAYILAMQAGRADDTQAAAARSRCLASPDVPPSCSDALRLSVSIAKLTTDNVEFVSSYTAYGEASTLCRLKLLKSI